MPGNMVEVGYTLYKVQSVSGVAVDDDDDEMPFFVYPGLNTMRDNQGRIRATKTGVVKVSKLPGTEGTGDKVFLWVDPDYNNHYRKEYDRHRHRANGNEFVMDEIEARTLRDPRWTRKEDIVEEIPEWPKNPMWYAEGKKDYAKQPDRAHSTKALTERERYEQADYDMYYSRMNNRSRSYTFNGKRYSYKNERLTEKPISVNENGLTNWRYPASPNHLYTAKRHDRKIGEKDRLRVYNVSDMFGTFWE
eukprot:TRINITY_DN22170_c1_g1_i2.p1 TRINITY_DN22170_c1_g1~~TRINITY_DN22170_c1_g1_i2.p1  ORF type:complete len:248 (+),score=38.03 TRINITY_DN22170_c1_g1_i2:231-974(+)